MGATGLLKQLKRKGSSRGRWHDGDEALDGKVVPHGCGSDCGSGSGGKLPIFGKFLPDSSRSLGYNLYHSTPWMNLPKHRSE
jgi:hypothetical protein